MKKIWFPVRKGEKKENQAKKEENTKRREKDRKFGL